MYNMIFHLTKSYFDKLYCDGSCYYRFTTLASGCLTLCLASTTTTTAAAIITIIIVIIMILILVLIIIII